MAELLHYMDGNGEVELGGIRGWMEELQLKEKETDMVP